MKRLNSIAEGVWDARTTVGIGLGVHLPLRMTVLRDDDGLLLYSPIELDADLLVGLGALGRVHTLIGPNRLHHMWLADAKVRFPDAKLLGAPGLAEKKPAISFDGVLDTGPLSDQVEALRIAGAEKLSEVVLLHRPSRSLVVGDAVFNIHEARGMTRFILKYLAGTLGRCEQSRLVRALTNDRSATARSVETLLALDFARVVPAHGEVLEEPDTKEWLRRGLWWWRGEARRPAPDAQSNTVG